MSNVNQNHTLKDKTFLTLIIPIYKPDNGLAGRLLKVDHFLSQWFSKYEIILVDDGNKERVKLPQVENLSSFKLIRLENNRGKGGAIREGIKHAQGDVCVFTDHDIPYHLSGLLYFVKAIGPHVDMVIGDRNLEASRYRVDVAFHRQLANWIFSKFLTYFTLGQGQDTQCGLKAFRKDVAKSIFQIQKMDDFSFDLEVIFLAKKFSLTIKKAPVKLVNTGPSTVSVFKDGFKMLMAMIKIFLNDWSGLYNSRHLKEISNRKYWEEYGRTLPSS